MPGVDPVEDMQAFIQLLNAGLMNSTDTAPGAEEHTGVCMHTLLL